MRENIFNLFCFMQDEFLEEIGVAIHNLDGTDEEKLALLRSSVEMDYRSCQRFLPPQKNGLSSIAPRITRNAYFSMMRLGRHMELFEEIFEQFHASANPICCITQVVDGKPKIDITTNLSPLTLSEDLGEGKMNDWLEDYMTPEGFDLPALINDDYFVAIKVLFNNKHYVSCMKLIASFIDTMAFLEYGDIKDNFVLWLNQFADLARLRITASQLWELRNSILHMSNLDSRKVLTGKEKRIGFCIRRKGTVSQGGTSIQYFNLLDLIDVLGDALSKWIQSMNTDRDKFLLFVERYDRIISDARQAITHN